MDYRTLFITGIGTEVGKTVVSSIFVTALKSDYFKPVQSGDLAYTDTDKVKEMATTPGTFHQEAYRLTEALSPHTSAAIDGVKINLSTLSLPITNNHLVVEGAGGLMVPLNDTEHLLDLIKKFKIPVVLVSRNYLGSINHSLLSYEILKMNEVPILGWVFNGPENKSGKDFIVNYSGLPVLLEVSEEEELSKSVIQKYASKLKGNLIAEGIL